MNAVLAIIPILPALSLAAEGQFLRGDVNDDGRVTLADSYFLQRFLFAEGASPTCRNAADADDDGNLRIEDIKRLFGGFARGPAVPAIPPPFPSMGSDPTTNPDTWVDCEKYTGRTELPPDPAARLRLLDAVAQGGDDNSAVLRIALSNSTSVVGYRGTLRLGGVIANFAGRLTRFTALPVPDDISGVVVEDGVNPQAVMDVWSYVRVTPETLAFGSVRMPPLVTLPIEPGEDFPVLEIQVCLAEGVKAGSYSIVLEDGELIDAVSGVSIRPSVSGGTLTVLRDLVPGTGCRGAPRHCPAPVADLEDLRARFALEDTVASPGKVFSVPLRIRSTADLRLYSFTVDFDEEVLEALGVEFTYQKPDGTPYYLTHFFIDPLNTTPGNAGIDEGYLAGRAWFSFTDDCNNIPAGVEAEACRLFFRVRPEAHLGVTELRFLDGAEHGGNDAYLVFDLSLRRENPDGLDLVGSKVYVAPDVPRFRRGDGIADGRLDISDPIGLLNTLFLGGAPPHCPDAFDSNDDGAVDITDAIFTLDRLFLGGRALPPPGADGCGVDPSKDELGDCFYEGPGC